MRYRRIALAAILAMGIFTLLYEKIFSSREDVAGSIYDFKVNALDGSIVDFARFRGKNLLVVNTASKCGYTNQYARLQELHELYGDQLAVLGFPSNDFLWQEPLSNSEIASFCEKNYGVSFQMFEKIGVRGRTRHPLYRWLSAKAGKKPSWNFCKYFVNGQGEVTGFYGPKVDPIDQEIIKQIIR